MSVRPSVCLSVTGRCCVKTAVRNTDLGILAWSLNSFDICPYVKEIWVFSEIRILSSGTVSQTLDFVTARRSFQRIVNFAG